MTVAFGAGTSLSRMKAACPGLRGGDMNQPQFHTGGEQVITGSAGYAVRTRDYCKRKGYEKPYQWAHFEDIPHPASKKPPTKSGFVLISVSEITARGAGRKEGDDESNVGGMYPMPAHVPLGQRHPLSHRYDRVATSLEDVDAFYPATALHEAVNAGRIGSLAERFRGICNAYCQRRPIAAAINAAAARGSALTRMCTGGVLC